MLPVTRGARARQRSGHRPRMARSTATHGQGPHQVDGRRRPAGWRRRPARRRRPTVCGGNSARARPSWPPWATTRQPTLSSRALVATTPIVVFAMPATPAPPSSWKASSVRRSEPRSTGPAVSVPSSTSPVAFTATQGGHHDVAVAHGAPRRGRRAGRARGPATCRRSRRCRRRPRPIVVRARPRAPRQAARPSAGPGRTGGSPTPRSKSDSPTTIGTAPNAVGNPTPSASSTAMTPSAAARPNAEPPVSTDGVEPRRPCGAASSSSSSRRRGRAAAHLARRDRALREQHDRAPGAGLGSVQCPTRTPSTSVITAHATPTSYRSPRLRSRAGVVTTFERDGDQR